MYYVYVLLSRKKKRLYVGRTNDLSRRVGEHQRGKVRSTNQMLPVLLIFYESFSSKADSIRRERYLKTSKGKSSLKQIIRESLQGAR